MADVTPVYGFPYQEATDPPDGASLGQDLAEAVEAEIVIVNAAITSGDNALDGRLDTIEANYPRGVVYQGNRSTASSTTSGTTAMGILRIDNMVLKAGHLYKFECGNIRATIATAGANFKLELRYNSSGTATTASTEIGRAEFNPAVSAAQWPGPPTGWVAPGVTTSVASVLLDVVRTNSAAASTFTSIADTGGLWLTVTDYGLAVSDTGVDV